MNLCEMDVIILTERASAFVFMMPSVVALIIVLIAEKRNTGFNHFMVSLAGKY